MSDPDSVLLLAVSKIMMPNVLDQIRLVNSDHADSILRDCIFLLTGTVSNSKGFGMTLFRHVYNFGRGIKMRQTRAP